MATTERDYYELLGVARDATEPEIKKAFRGLARELHPDVSDAPDAHERFREVVEAYEVLSKSETRELYDRYGHAGLRSGGLQPGHFDFGSLSDLFSAVFGDDLLDSRAGIQDGQRIRLTGEGRAGTLGTRAGDAYVQVHVRPDPRFVREGNDIFSTVDLTMTQASLGASITIPTLDGDDVLEFAAGTQPGQVLLLRGLAMPVLQGFGRGDHRVLVTVVGPRHLSDEQRRLLEEFDSHADERTYKPDEGLFEKLKSAFR